MAVPKKRTSKTKTRIRRSIWRDKANKTSLKAFSLAKSILTNRSRSFYYSINDESFNSSESVSTDKDEI
uniref:Large ribosomal subunit protein bL32c n=1 Tax=Apopellia endiviifolia TaxID=304445 RepID=K4JY55_9MARC|nr:ribosomal protein L32 [Apopellia endiviifolia]AFU88894.1 ribosomal protein L32 [Apopellia endiviifolia]WIA67777.1 ribosomal protein L32 [Apopellia endiviifolia]WKW94986.1 ribosomal protein L32 [Apopellia endiviifolia]